MAVQADLNEVLYLAATMGFLGGFSTLSTMNYEAVELVLGGKRARSARRIPCRDLPSTSAPQRSSSSPSRARSCSLRAQLPPCLPRRWRGFRCSGRSRHPRCLQRSAAAGSTWNQPRQTTRRASPPQALSTPRTGSPSSPRSRYRTRTNRASKRGAAIEEKTHVHSGRRVK